MAAITSDAFIAISNSVGWWRKTVEGDVRCAGGSGIVQITPHTLSNGIKIDYIVQAQNYLEDFIVKEINLKEVADRRKYIRKNYPYWRRPETYQLITNVKAEESHYRRQRN
ncbi:hypothetical protein AKJ50_01965 [candidate division MSBL1 archaeon SCGC-AAA382A13]|uniref:Uncharacterized protein n=1 Tax=candidate division MSBL1 archaeon SCGC-AAA382A13 TaxID=1698279 RepID=A0A133VEG6_9EURY|nr:hypothetical protein AKJ50_01965 [candidate division MSBL1 archaeon SCGC-AAA382A13]